MPDPNSFSNLDVCVSKSLKLDLFVDFEKKVLDGVVIIEVEALRDGTSELILDNKGLIIHDVTTLDGHPLSFTHIAPSTDHGLGQALHITLPNPLQQSQRESIKIRYVTSPDAFALQWLTGAQTAGKIHPYLYTQCEAVHARSMVPCQDTPGAKVTYTASVTVPAPLVALMSAESLASTPVHPNLVKFEFAQNIAVPSYLIALAVGDLHSKDISPRCRVWSEIGAVEKAADEFVDTERFLSAAEDICGPYVWGRYDLLVLPPSFPFGGMENPCLTFVTPTLLAGDRSLVNVIAHEIAHSWTGNLVTNASWEHFWLNEGFTVFVERKIIGRIYGKAHQDFHGIMGQHALSQAIEHMGCTCALTKLVVDLEKVHPDDAFSTVPYEKGFSLLVHLEDILGGPAIFEPYLRAHLSHFAYQTITTTDWLGFLHEYFHGNARASSALKAVDWPTWLHAPGMPVPPPAFDTSLADAAHALAARWAEVQPGDVSMFSSNDIAQFVSSQVVVFLNRLEGTALLSHRVLRAMDTHYSLTPSENAEINLAWFTVCLQATYEPIFPHVVAFITRQGRMKYVRPLYRALYGAGVKGRALALETFKENVGQYHNIASAMIAKDLMLK